MSNLRSFLTPGLVLTALALLLSGCSYPSRTATSTAALASGTFSSGETLEVLRVLNDGEIAQAELAQDKTENDQVEDVAETIIDDHMKLNERIDDLIGRGIEPERSPLSRGLTRQARAIQEELEGLYGREFDCMYLTKQVEQHQLALDTLRNEVKPDTKDPEVEDLLDDAIEMLEHHREDAARVRADIRGCR